MTDFVLLLFFSSVSAMHKQPALVLPGSVQMRIKSSQNNTVERLSQTKSMVLPDPDTLQKPVSMSATTRPKTSSMILCLSVYLCHMSVCNFMHHVMSSFLLRWLFLETQTQNSRGQASTAAQRFGNCAIFIKLKLTQNIK